MVNISTSQTVAPSRSVPTPQLPPGSPFEEFFEEFFKRRQQQGDDGDDTPRRVSSLGSGFVIDAGGLIVTNNHVIADADEIYANFNDGSKLKAELVGRDTKIDIALLKVTPLPDKPLKAVKFGDSDGLRVGDWVMAIGNPFGLGGTLTVGVISARNRDINSGPYDNFLQTDAAINRGNSGGPLFNMDGDVIGINTAIISPSGGSIGIGFAVPSNTALAVVNQLRQYGEMRRGWIGVRIQSVTDEIAESLSLGKPRGALVGGLTDDGPAAKGGIKPGDVIIKFDGKDVRDMRSLPIIVADTPVDKDVEVVVVRKGKEETLRLKVGRLEESDKAEQAALDQEGARGHHAEGADDAPARPRSVRDHHRAARQVQAEGRRQGRRRHLGRWFLAGRDQGAEARHGHRRGQSGSGGQARRHPEAHRRLEEGRPPLGAADGLGCRRPGAVHRDPDRVSA